jgi:hypothetical protein
MSKVDSQLLSDSIDKIISFAKGEEVDGEKGKKRGFVETVELQVRTFVGHCVRSGRSREYAMQPWPFCCLCAAGISPQLRSQ